MKSKWKKIISGFLAVMFVVSLAFSSGNIVVNAEEDNGTKDLQEQIEEKREEIKRSYFSDTDLSTYGIETFAAEKTVHMERVRDIRYNGFITRYFTVNGNAAWCLEPAKFAPVTGDYRARVIDNTSDLAKVMYYSTDAPGEKALCDWYGSKGFWQHADVWSGAAVASHDDRFVYSHMVLSWVYSNYDYDAAFFGTDLYGQSWFNEVKQDFLAKVDAVLALPDPPKSFTAYVLDTGSTQVIGGWDYTPTGYARLRKSSADPTLTDGNDCYSLKSAKYGVYSDAACKKLVKELTTGEDGTSNTVDLSPGKYYVKEINAPKGYLKDEEVHEVTVKDSQTAEVRVEDEPGNDPAVIEISKIDQESGELITQGAASLAGTQFTVTHYGKLYTKDEIESGAADQDATANGIAKRSWVIQTKVTKTGKYRAILNASNKVSGDEFYYTDGNPNPTLPLGTLVVEETKAPEGYLLDGSYLTAVGSTEKITGKYISQITKMGELVKLQGGNQYAMSDRVIRGGVKIQKRDLETGDTKAQGSAALKGTEFSIISLNENPVLVDGKQYRKNEMVKKIVSGADGTAATGNEELPYGHYRIEETKAPNGYLTDGAKAVEFSITENGKVVDLTGKKQSVSNQIIRGGVKIQKRDLETGDTKAQGNATLKDTEFAIISLNENPVLVAGKLYQKNEVVKKIQTGLDGTAATSADLLPYGHYRIKEAKAPEGYLTEGAESVDFSITKDGKVVDLTDKSHSIYNQIKRGDLEGVKIGDGTHKRLAGVPFKITSKTTGESHVVVTDENGQFSTASDWVSHKQNTNAGKSSEDGIWFGVSEPDDSKGALPYDTYEIEELSCNSNRGMKLIPAFEVVVRKDKVKIHLGTLTDDYEKPITIHTTAAEQETGEKTIVAGKKVTIVDTVTLDGLKKGRKYQLKGWQMLKEASTELLVDGKRVESDHVFTADSEEMKVEVSYTFDASKLGGQNLVTFEELYDLGNPEDPVKVAEHKDIDDEGQTVLITERKISIHTTATDPNGMKEIEAGKDLTIVDTVTLDGLEPGVKYKLSGWQMVKADNAKLIIDGKEVTGEYEFLAESEKMEVRIEFTFDGSTLGGKQLVTFEELYDLSNPEEPEKVAEHKDIEDEGQTVTIKEIPETPEEPETPDMPRTGDRAFWYLFLGLFGSIAAIGSIVMYRKKRVKQ